MEYGDMIDSFENFINPDNGYLQSDLYSSKYVGFERNDNPDIKFYYSNKNVRTISNKITELLRGVHPENRPIIVPDKTIYSVMDSIYHNYRPATGDIYGRYNIPTGNTTQSYVQDMIDQVIEIIVSDVKTNYETEINNSKLSAWTTVLGEFNDHKLRAYSVIKIRERRPAPLQFNLNY